MTVRWTVRADGDQGAQFAPRPSPIRVANSSKKCHADLAHLVERHLAKVEVAGSSPVIRSKRKTVPSWYGFSFGTQCTALLRTSGDSPHKSRPRLLWQRIASQNAILW